MDDRCELCALPLPEEHPHLFERQRRAIVCACAACAMLFDMLEGRRYRRIQPFVRRVQALGDDATLAALGVPVGLAFLAPGANGDVIAAYPGPAGATLARVDQAAWASVLHRHPALRDLEPDVEALLINRIAPAPAQYRVSIDYCYQLAGLVRSRWTGVGGGPGVAAAIADFFRMLDERAA